MYKNYGDVDFFEYGMLVDSDHSDCCFNVLVCRPLCEEDENGNELYAFADCYIDIEDEWLDAEKIESYCGKWDSKEHFVCFCIDYYGFNEFSDSWDGYIFTREEIEKKLKNYFIASDNLHVTW